MSYENIEVVDMLPLAAVLLVAGLVGWLSKGGSSSMTQSTSTTVGTTVTVGGGGRTQ